MVRKTRKQKGGDLKDNGSGFRTGIITIEGKTYNIQPRANLEGKILEYANLNEANLEGANLTNTKLNSANLNGANLNKANLEGAQLKRAKLENAQLQGANLNEAILQEAQLQGANLTGANLTGANLFIANLTGANLTGTKYNKNTIWPRGFRIPETALPVQEEEPVLVQEPEPVPEPELGVIRLTKNMTKSNNSNSCNYLLYQKIMGLPTYQIETSTFKFEGQTGTDVGGLTRIVHDLFLKSFINKFFVGNETKILGNKFKYEELKEATERVIALTKNTKIVFNHIGETTTGSINFIPIEPNLLNILLTKNVEYYINQNNNKNKYHIIGTFSYLNKAGRDKYGIDLINATNATNVTNETIKKYMIAFLTINGFDSYQQYLNMREWIQTYWNPEMFSNHLSFDFETFSERVLLKFKNNKGIFSPEVKLSYFIKNNHSADYNKYNLLPLFLEYLLSDNEQYRINFTMLVSGSSTYGGILRIIFEEQHNPLPFKAHTCSCEINIYNNKVSMGILGLNDVIEELIKNPNLKN